MRILTVNTMDRSGGAEKIASDLVSRFRNTGHPTTFAVGRKRGGIADIEFPQDREYDASSLASGGICTFEAI